ncbi:MAG: hypothetical protein ACOC88_01005 [Candidatus Bipolaricaulota bacterium]
MKNVEISSSYWGTLPIPREWKASEDSSGSEKALGDELVRFMMDEWLSAHPMDGG